MTPALAKPGYAHAKSPRAREALAKRVLNGFTALDAKLADFADDVRALWQEFESLSPDETILGCRTKKEFCETHLHRTPRAVRYMLDGGNPVSKRGETVSPPPKETAAPKETFHKADYLKPNPLSAARITADLTSVQLQIADYTNSVADEPSLNGETRIEIATLIRTMRELSRKADRLELVLKRSEIEVAA